MNVEKVIFLGGNRFNENGPLTNFIEICNKRNIKTMVLSNSSRLDYPINLDQNLREFLISLKIDFIENDDVNLNLLEEHIDSKTILFSVNCEVILKSDFIKVVQNNIFNYHNATLPSQKGASSHSWRIMQDNKMSHLTIHRLTEQIDSGEIVLQKEILFPDTVKTLKETYEYIENEEIRLFDDFLNNFENGFTKETSILNGEKSFYWPRLNTDTDGYVIWSWSAKQIVDFCNAFDEPFEGASSYVNGNRVRLKNVQTDDEDTYFHPYQYGLIYRKNKHSIWIACKNGGVKIDNVILEDGAMLKLGDRFTNTNIN